MDVRRVGDHRHRLGKAVGLAVECDDLLARRRLARDEPARELGAVIDVERPPEIEHHVIGDVDQRRDRPLADRGEAAAHPLGRLAIGEAADALCEESGAARRIVGAHVGAFARALDRRIGKRLGGAEPGDDQIERDPAHAHAIGPVGEHVDVDHRVVQPGIIGIGHPDRRIGGQLDDAVMVFAELELARRAHHAVRLDPADRRDLEHHAVRRHRRTGRAEHADEPRTRVRCTAHDLERAIAGVDRKHLQLVRLRMRRGAEHLGHPERGKRGTRILDAFDLEADPRQRLDDRVERCVGVDMLLEPVEGDLHAPTPWLSVGTSSAEKP